jgi:hypothetical protein
MTKKAIFFVVNGNVLCLVAYQVDMDLEFTKINSLRQMSLTAVSGCWFVWRFSFEAFG